MPTRIIHLVAEVLIVLFFGAMIAVVLSFLAAETPEYAIRVGHPPLPQGWEAGVFNHGSYYQWYTISSHPFIFGLSLAGLGLSAILMVFSTKHLLTGGRNAS